MVLVKGEKKLVCLLPPGLLYDVLVLRRECAPLRHLPDGAVLGGETDDPFLHHDPPPERVHLGEGVQGGLRVSQVQPVRSSRDEGEAAKGEVLQHQDAALFVGVEAARERDL